METPARKTKKEKEKQAAILSDGLHDKRESKGESGVDGSRSFKGYRVW
ncbi:hypothetical protein [Undibacterium sp.]